MRFTPFLYLSGGGSVVHYITGAEIQRATKLLEKQSDTLTSVMKQKIRELEESKNSFFRYEGLKLYLFWGGMVCNILVFLMLLYGMLGK